LILKIGLKNIKRNNMEIKNEFIPYEQALALKELGFDEPCFGHYWENLFYYETTHHHPSTMPNSPESCLAPLYQQAFRWFREKYNLKSWIQEHTSDTFIYEIRPHVLSDYKQGETYVYTNYEEAELACLKKLIEIVKNK